MNGILGYLNLDGAPVASEKLSAMQTAMAYWGVDGADSWSDGPAGQGCQYCFCAPEETRGTQPYHDTERGWVITGGAFLDNREELIDELGLSVTEARELPDSLLLHRAYARWGEDCVHHLLGDWSFAVWDINKRRLFLARDHIGNTGVCYTKGPGFFAFASSRKALLALPEVPQAPNLLRLAQVLTSWPGDGVLTAYDGIYRLPPAHCLTLQDGMVETRQYWFPEPSREAGLSREDDCLDAFMAQYDRAVKVRLRANTAIAATLSGGLDSGSVCALAARALAHRGERLAGFTSVPLEDTSGYTSSHRFGDESPLARATAEHAGAIDLTWIPAREVSPVAGIERMLQVHDEPGHAAGNQFWIVALLEQVRNQGKRVLLTGQGGNATVSWTGGPVNLWPYLWGWKLSEFKERFWDLKKRHGLSLLGGLKRFLAGPLVALVRRRRQYGIATRTPFLSYSAIHPQWALSLKLADLMRAEGHDPFFNPGFDPLKIRYKIIKPGRSIGGALWGESSGAYGLEVRDPTIDKRLLEFCLGVPDRYHFADGMDRAVLRRAFHHLLPDEVRLNRRRGLQAAAISRRVRDSGSQVEAVLQRLERHSMASNMLDLVRMRKVLQSVQSGGAIANISDTSAILLRGLGVGMFILRFP